ncbi:sensor histidine kinase [Cohnella faecalis]|uniref:sensor histidine kinase n=1 Tax=Cohnella faecalis TaxID=2315694 RepID=UPI001313EB52|nr:ATP-binding protein [Cohnella faecalis]
MQEALTNAIRHGEANGCIVRLFEDKGVARIEIDDDGRGVPEPYVPGIGIRSMKERAEELGGSFRLRTIPGQGTSVQVTIPCGREEMDDGIA